MKKNISSPLISETSYKDVQTLIEHLENNLLSENDKLLLLRLLQFIVILLKIVESKKSSILGLKQSLFDLISRETNYSTNPSNLEELSNASSIIEETSLSLPTNETITKPKEVWEALEKSDKRLKLVLDLTNGAWWEWNCVTGKTLYSPHFGYEASQQAEDYKDLKDRVHPEDRENTEELLLKNIRENTIFYDLQHRVRTKFGEWCWVSANGVVSKRDEKGSPLEVIGVSLDITKYKDIEEKLRKSDENLNLAQEVSNTGSWFLDIVKDKLEWSAETYRMFGIPLNTPLNLEAFLNCIHPEDRESVVSAWNAALFGANYDSEHRITVGDKIKWVRERAKVKFSPQDLPISALGTVQDVTDLKETQIRLEQFLRFFLISPDLNCIIKKKGTFQELNPSFTKLLGFSQSELLAKPFIDFVFLEDKASTLELLEKLVKEDTVINFENRYICKDGSYLWVSWNFVSDKNGFIYATGHNITKIKLTEIELKRSNAILEATPAFVASAYLDGTLIRANKALYDVLGITEFKNHNIRDFHPEWVNDLIQSKGIPTAINNGVWVGELAFINKYGVEVPILQAIVAHRDENNELSFLSAIATDITKRKEIEERETKRIEKLCRLSELSFQLSGDPLVIFQSVVSMIAELFSIPIVCLSQIEKDELLFKAIYIKGQFTNHLGSCPLSVTPCATVEETKCLSTFDDVSKLFPEASFLQDHNVYSYCGFPSIDEQGKVVAVTCLLDEKAHEFSEEDKQILVMIGQRVALEIQRSKTILTSQQAEEALRQSEKQLREAQRIAHIGNWKFDVNKKLVDWSDEMYQIFETNRQEFGSNEESLRKMFHPEDRETIEKVFYDSIANKSNFDITHRILVKDEKVKYVHVQGFHTYDDNDKPIHCIGTVQDITNRVIAEQKIKASLREKEVMLKEIHHRVKNNLQIITSLLNLQSTQLKDPKVIAAFTETKNRIRSMSLLHEALYKSENFTRIDLASYINSLCAHLSRSYGTNGSEIKILVDVQEIELELEQTIPIGLIINELLSNALKHAFTDQNSGQISVKLIKLEDSLSLSISDNGKGLTKDLDFHMIETLGLNLVSDLTRQLKGIIKLDTSKGTSFNIFFPLLFSN